MTLACSQGGPSQWSLRDAIGRMLGDMESMGSGSRVDSSACILNSEEKKEDLHMKQPYVNLLIDALLDEGFTVEEAIQLIQIQEQYEEQRKQRRAIEETNHHRFIRWLVEHGRLSDW